MYRGYCMQIRQMNFLRLTTSRKRLDGFSNGCRGVGLTINLKKKTEMLALTAEHDFFIDDILLENVDKFSRAVVSFSLRKYSRAHLQVFRFEATA